jgi:excisionase family DNA binding protein
VRRWSTQDFLKGHAVSKVTPAKAETEVGGDGNVESDADVDLISIPEAARRLGMHRDSLYSMAREGSFEPAVRIGRRHWVVSVPRLQRMLHGDAA